MLRIASPRARRHSVPSTQPVIAVRTSPLSLVYIGDDSFGATSRHRFEAIKRLGYTPELLTTNALLPSGDRRWFWRLSRLTGNQIIQKPVARRLAIGLASRQFDVAWIDAGFWCGLQPLKELKRVCKKVVLYNVDDPTGSREPLHWKQLLKAMPLFDAIVVVRAETKADLEKLGCRSVYHVWRTYDEVEHSPERAKLVPNGELTSDVAFIGTRMEDRPEFLRTLIDAKVPIRLWGNGWSRCRGWEKIQTVYEGRSLFNEEYVAAIQRSKICIGTLSKMNRDQHTQRSSEVPYAGGLLCAPRTTEHSKMFEDGVNAILWDSWNDCASKCLSYLQKPEKLSQMQRLGQERIKSLRLGNEDCLGSILRHLEDPSSAYVPHTPLLSDEEAK